MQIVETKRRVTAEPKKSLKIDLRESDAPGAPQKSSGFIRGCFRLFATSSRPLRVVMTFAGVLLAFMAYRLAVVPILEPSIKLTSQKANPRNLDRVKLMNEQRLEKIASYFPEDAWERKNPTILESDRAQLLINEYRNRGKDGLELIPCTIVFRPSASANAAQSRTIILQAERAYLRFDRPFDLSRGDIGQLVGGKLEGAIQIRGIPNTPNAKPDLEITTRDAELVDQVLMTPHEVKFRFGANYGQGQQLKLYLAPSDTSGLRQGPANIGGVDYLELSQNVHMHIQPGDRGLMPGDGAASESTNTSTQLPVDVRCQGAFRFDVTQSIASFREQVTVVRNNLEGPADQLNCEILSIFFQSKDKENAPAADDNRSGGLGGLEPVKLEARGAPVLIHAPSTNAEARGQRLEYHIPTGQVILEGENGVILKHRLSQIQALRIDYTEAPEAGRIGTLHASGPGQFQSQLANDHFEAHWANQLSIQPAEQGKVLTLAGATRLRSGTQGEMSADLLHLWFNELVSQNPAAPQDAPRVTLIPRTMRATGNVQLNSVALVGATNDLTLWFRTGSSHPSDNPVPVGGAVGIPPASHTPHYGAQQASFNETAPAASQQRYRFQGQLLQAQVGLQAGNSAVEMVTLQGDALFEQLGSTPDEASALKITGQGIQATNIHRPDTHLTVSGTPGVIEAQGMHMLGDTIQLNRGQNRLWIDGPGKMQLPMSRDLQGMPLAQTQPLDINWRKGMNFDGQIASFLDQVIVQTESQMVRTDEMRVLLKQRVLFAQQSGSGLSSSDTALEQFDCIGPFAMESRTRKPDGSMLAIERINASDLMANLTSGEIRASGPGQVISHRFGAAASMPGTAEPSEAKKNQLNFTRVDFLDRLSGSLFNKQMTFQRGVKTVFGPVANWDAVIEADLHGPGPEDFLLKCHEMTVSQIAGPGNQQTPDSIHMAALGNVKVETTRFDASAHRVTYEQAKNLLVLDSDGNNDVEMFNAANTGSNAAGHVNARKVQYWTDSGRMVVDGVGYTGFDRVGHQAPSRSPR